MKWLTVRSGYFDLEKREERTLTFLCREKLRRITFLIFQRHSDLQKKFATGIGEKESLAKKMGCNFSTFGISAFIIVSGFPRPAKNAVGTLKP